MGDIEETYMYIASWKKLIWKGYILYDSNCLTFLKKQNYKNNKKTCGFHGLREIEGGWIYLVQDIL